MKEFEPAITGATVPPGPSQDDDRVSLWAISQTWKSAPLWTTEDTHHGRETKRRPSGSRCRDHAQDDRAPLKRAAPFRPRVDGRVQEGGSCAQLFHELRRTAVRNLEGQGVPRSRAMRLTGHKTKAVYRRYAIVSERDLVTRCSNSPREVRAQFRAQSPGVPKLKWGG